MRKIKKRNGIGEVPQSRNFMNGFIGFVGETKCKNFQKAIFVNKNNLKFTDSPEIRFLNINVNKTMENE